jgi:hypothetical protein
LAFYSPCFNTLCFPASTDPAWQESFQNYDRLVASASLRYADASLDSVTVTVSALHRDASVELSFQFGQGEPFTTTSEASFSAAGGDTGPLVISVSAHRNDVRFAVIISFFQPLPQVKGSDGSSVVLEPVDFRWDAPAVSPQVTSPFRCLRLSISLSLLPSHLCFEKHACCLVAGCARFTPQP